MSDTAFCPPPSDWKRLPRHEYSEAMGDMTEAEFVMIGESVKEHGFAGRPILLVGNKTFSVADGWHTLRACVLHGVTPVFERYTGNNLLEAVWIRHGARKHWSPSQRAMIAAKVATLRDGVTARCANLHTSGEAPKTRDDAAKMLNVSSRSISDARKVIDEGTPVLQKAVLNGEVTVSDAARISDRPPKVQNAAVKAVEKGKAPTVRKAVQDREPGDDTEIEKAQKKVDRQAVKDNGIQVQELNKNVEKLIGQLTRAFDDRARIMGKSAGHKGCLAAMENVLKAWKAWKSAK